MTTLRVPAGESFIEFQKNSVLYGLKRRKTLIADEPGLGKGHPLTTRILTPAGYTPVGQISVGDDVIGSNGKKTKVTAIYERGMLPVYKVTTNDGASTLVDGDHLWYVHEEIEDVFETVNTLELLALLKEGRTVSIPLVSEPVEFLLKPTLPPAFNAGVMAVAKSDLYAEDLPDIDHSLFETASVDQRMMWLSGVVRTKAKVRQPDNHLSVVVRRTEHALKDTIVQIVRSLGGLAFVSPTFQRWSIKIYLPDHLWRPIVGYPRPESKVRKRWRRFEPGVPTRHIVSVTPAGVDHVRCISVAAADQLYLTEEHIVTHNTVSALGIANNIGEVNSMLVICLASHKIHWQRAVERWDLNGLSVGIAEGDYLPDTECVVINYDIVHRHYDALRAGTWDIMIVDEAHFLQNAESRRTLNIFGGKLRIKEDQDAPEEDENGDLVKQKRSKAKWVWKKWEPIMAKREVFLTGTPIPNRVKNMWPLIKRCDPKGLGRNYDAFAYRYCGAFETFHGMDDNGASNLEELNHILKDRFMIRHLKAEVLKELPAKVRQIIPLASEGLQKKVQAEKDAVAELLAAYEAKMGIHIDMDEMSLSDLVLKARPALLEEYAKTASDNIGMDTPLNKLAIARQELALAKLPMAIEYITNLMNSGEKVVVFAYHRAVVEALRDRWADTCACIYGGTPTKKRQLEADRFQTDPACNPFIGQYTAAGTGYTLIAACHVVGVEMTWLPHELTQAEDRCHRIGQEDTVWVHHLIVEGSMDEGMFAKITAKQKIIDAALN